MSCVCEASKCTEAKMELNEEGLRWELNEDAMATEKLAEGIRRFAADARKLEQLIGAQLSAVAN